MSDRRRPDAFAKRARREGFPARSVFKLEEIDRRTRLLRPGQRVLDLGAAPGSWSLYASQKVGPRGVVVAVDLSEVRTELPANVVFRQLDALGADPAALVALAGSPADEARPFDVVLSDMAPSTTGARDVDQARSFELFCAALRVAASALRPGGSFVGKIFQGPDFEEARKIARSRFEEVRLIRPRGTRSDSYEIFVVGLRLAVR